MAWFGALCCSLWLTAPASAEAQTLDDGTRAAARSISYEAALAYESGDYADAALKFEKAYSLVQVPTLGLASARSLEKLGKLVDAAERYLQVTRLILSEPDIRDGKLDVQVQEQARADAASELAALTPRIPTVVLTLEGATAAEVSLTLDGVTWRSVLIGERQPLNPGSHQIVAWKGDQHAEMTVNVTPASHESVVLRFELPPPATPPAAPPGIPLAAALASPETVDSVSPLPPARASSQHLWGWISLGTGAAALSTGAIMGLLAVDQKDEIEDRFGSLVCPPEQPDKCQSYNTQRSWATVGLVAGGVLGAASIALFALPVAGDDSAAVELRLLASPEGAMGAVRLSRF